MPPPAATAVLLAMVTLAQTKELKFRRWIAPPLVARFPLKVTLVSNTSPPATARAPPFSAMFGSNTVRSMISRSEQL